MKKELELKHLCIYLPYRIKCITPIQNNKGNIGAVELTGIVNGNARFDISKDYMDCFLYEIKPILISLSELNKPMEGQKVTTWIDYLWHEIISTDNDSFNYDDFCTLDITNIDWYPLKVIEYLFANHFDVFGLIEQGLAIDKGTL
jgi:hypothetical protein